MDMRCDFKRPCHRLAAFLADRPTVAAILSAQCTGHNPGPSVTSSSLYNYQAFVRSLTLRSSAEPTSTQSTMAVAPLVPNAPAQPRNNTVYIRNLEERIRIPALLDNLRELFSDYGTILDIVARKNLRAKGQAFVVFEDEDAAATAIDEIQGFELFEKPMILDFAKTKSDKTVEVAGDEAELEAHKRRRMAEKERKQAAEEADRMQKEKLKRPREPVEEEGKVKQQRVGGGLKSTGAKTSVVPDEYLPPNKILFVQNIPEDYDADALSAVFGRFEGFMEVRLVPTKKGIAFVEYEGESGAINAKESTGGMQLGGQQIKVTYQRK